MRAEGSVQLAGSALLPAKCIGPSRKKRAQDDKYGDAGEIQYSKLSTQYSKLETRNSKLETRNSKLETLDFAPQIGAGIFRV